MVKRKSRFEWKAVWVKSVREKEAKQQSLTLNTSRQYVKWIFKDHSDLFTQSRTFFKLKLDMVIIRVNIYFDFSVSVICLKTIYDDNVDFYCALTRRKKNLFFYFSLPRHIPKWLKELYEWLNWEVYRIDELNFRWKQKRQRSWLIAAEVSC